MEWLNPYGSLWSTPTFGGRFFSADCEAVWMTYHNGYRHVVAERFPSTTEGVHELMDAIKSLWDLFDAVSDDYDCFAVHEALGLLVDGDFADEGSVYDRKSWVRQAGEYEDGIRDALDHLVGDLVRFMGSSEGAKEKVRSWVDVSDYGQMTATELLNRVTYGELAEAELIYA